MEDNRDIRNINDVIRRKHEVIREIKDLEKYYHENRSRLLYGSFMDSFFSGMNMANSFSKVFHSIRNVQKGYKWVKNLFGHKRKS